MDILLVEDNVLNQKVIVFNLKKLNYNVVAVGDGLDAIKKILDTPFDIVLMDLMLPGMNGYEITREIRRIEKEKGVENPVPIIAITARSLATLDAHSYVHLVSIFRFAGTCMYKVTVEVPIHHIVVLVVA